MIDSSVPVLDGAAGTRQRRDGLLCGSSRKRADD
jgi:hypothetical protein